MTTSEDLAARVREDVDRNGDLIRKREDARRTQDMTVDDIMTGPVPMSEEGQRRADEVKARPRRPLPVEALPIRPSSWQRVTERTCACGEPSGKISICADCTRKKYSDFNHGGTGHPEYLRLLDEIRALHMVKSGGYGTGEDPFANFTAVAAASGEPRYLYAVLRSIEKLTRCLSLHSQGRADEIGEEFADVASLLLCAEAMRRSDS